MSLVTCPHCKSHRFVPAKVPREVIVVMSCPACHELSVIYGGKVVPLHRKLLEGGDLHEIKEHLAQVIAEFIQSGLFTMLHKSEGAEGDEFQPDFGEMEYVASEPGEAEYTPTPITQQEVERFAKIDLKCLDDPAYFKKHFG